MKGSISLYLDLDLVKKAKKQGLSISNIANSAIIQAINSGTLDTSDIQTILQEKTAEMIELAKRESIFQVDMDGVRQELKELSIKDHRIVREAIASVKKRMPEYRKNNESRKEFWLAVCGEARIRIMEKESPPGPPKEKGV